MNAGDAVPCSNFFFHCFKCLISFVKIKLLWLQTWTNFQLCFYSNWHFQINKKLNSAQMSDTTLLHSTDEIHSPTFSSLPLPASLLTHSFIFPSSLLQHQLTCSLSLISFFFCCSNSSSWWKELATTGSTKRKSADVRLVSLPNSHLKKGKPNGTSNYKRETREFKKTCIMLVERCGLRSPIFSRCLGIYLLGFWK